MKHFPKVGSLFGEAIQGNCTVNWQQTLIILGEAGRLLAGKYLLPRDLLLEVEDEDGDDDFIKYSVDVLVLFVKYRASSQSLYVKKVTSEKKVYLLKYSSWMNIFTRCFIPSQWLRQGIKKRKAKKEVDMCSSQFYVILYWNAPDTGTFSVFYYI